MFMMTIGFPLAVLIILTVLVHALTVSRRSTTISTAAIFAVVNETYLCVLAGEWRPHFPILAAGAFAIALTVSCVAGLFARKAPSDFV